MRHRWLAAVAATIGIGLTVASPAFGQAAGPDLSVVTVTVDAKHPWVDSGLTVRKGDRFVFEAAGVIHWGAQSDQVAGPEGHGAKPGKVGAGGLIGRVGFSGKAFPIGDTRTPIAMTKSGKLFLGINDFVFGDNAGAFHVKVRRASN